MYDQTSDGIPAIFLDGPKQGHMGCVTPTKDMPPKALQFGEGLVYLRVEGVHKFKAHDLTQSDTTKPRKYKGVAYRMDKSCPFAKEVERIDREAIQRIRRG